MRVFLDANILFSAAKSGGAIRQFLETLLEAGHECWVDGYVVEEARRNLSVKAGEQLEEFSKLLEKMKVAAVARDIELEADLPLAEKDRPVLAAAIRSGCDALVTGDKTHFGALFGRVVQGVRIHSPRSLGLAVAAAGNAAHERSGRYKARKAK